MTQKSLVYMVLAVAVGYILVSAVPQQVAMYTTPKQMLLTGGSEELFSSDGSTVTVSPEDDSGDIADAAQAAEAADAAQAAEAAEAAASQAESLEVRGSRFEPSLLEQSHLPELAKWWTLDLLIALVIYWVAKQRLA